MLKHDAHMALTMAAGGVSVQGNATASGRHDCAPRLPGASSLGRGRLAALGAELATLRALAADDLAAVAYARLAIAGRLGRAASVWPVGVLEHALGAAQLSASAPAELSALRAALGSPAEEARWAAGGRAAFFSLGGLCSRAVRARGGGLGALAPRGAFAPRVQRRRVPPARHRRPPHRVRNA